MKILKVAKLWDMSKLKVKSCMPGPCNICKKKEKHQVGMCVDCYSKFMKKYK